MEIAKRKLFQGNKLTSFKQMGDKKHYKMNKTLYIHEFSSLIVHIKMKLAGK